MESFLQFLAANRDGILILLLVLLVVALVIRWMAWMFGLGRFKLDDAIVKPVSPMGYLVSTLLTKVIGEFRHLLALVMVTLFAVMLFIAMLPGLIDGNVVDLLDGLQGVAAALGGLIGSIIGYYFGESAGRRAVTPRDGLDPEAPLVQGEELSTPLILSDEMLPAAPAPGQGEVTSPEAPEAPESDDPNSSEKPEE